jgi:bifunctional DNase/RNase
MKRDFRERRGAIFHLNSSLVVLNCCTGFFVLSDDCMYLAMNVSALTADPLTCLPLVILSDARGDKTLAVSVGQREAAAIAAELDGIELERPSTHQLTCRLIETAGASISRAEIVDYSGDAWHARIVIALADGTEVSEPARCSDAIALALHVGAPLLVAIRVVDACTLVDMLSSRPIVAEGARPRSVSGRGARDRSADLESLADDLFGKWKM